MQHSTLTTESIGTLVMYQSYILFGLRKPNDSETLDWDWIGGKVDDTDSSVEAAYKRELKEEVGEIAATVISEHSNLHNVSIAISPFTNKQILFVKCVIPNMTVKNELVDALFDTPEPIPGLSHHAHHKWMTREELESGMDGNPIAGYNIRAFLRRCKDTIYSQL